MKKWQKDRNYRRIKNEQGEILANIITIAGKDIEVPEEVFLAYSQADWRERYIAEEVEPGKVLSLDQLLEDHVPLEKLGAVPEVDAERIVLERESGRRFERAAAMLPAALLQLSSADRKLVQALFFDGVSTREYARRLGISQRAVINRRDRILCHMRKFLKIFSD